VCFTQKLGQFNKNIRGCTAFFVLFGMLYKLFTVPLGMVSQHIWCLSQARIKLESCGRKGIWHKNGGHDGGGLLISPDGVAPSRMVGVSAFVILPCTIKSRRRFLLALAHLDSSGKRAIKWLCVCVCVCRCKFSLSTLSDGLSSDC